jgi:hypothetical protein
MRRVWLESAGFLIDPVGGFNRIFRGEVSRVYPNPQERDPNGLSAWLRYGVRTRGDQNLNFGTEATGTVTDFRLIYGDAFGKADKPFDSYSVRFEAASADSGFLNGLRGEGLIVALSNPTEQPNMHRYVLTQCFDFYDNAAYQYGARA